MFELVKKIKADGERTQRHQKKKQIDNKNSKHETFEKLIRNKSQLMGFLRETSC